MEQHQDRQQQEHHQKRSKRKRGEGGGKEGRPCDTGQQRGQAWVPFDREKDMQETTDSKSRYAAMLQGESSLGSRFQKGK